MVDTFISEHGSSFCCLRSPLLKDIFQPRTMLRTFHGIDKAAFLDLNWLGFLVLSSLK
jgi:hypothetical protein